MAKKDSATAKIEADIAALKEKLVTGELGAEGEEVALKSIEDALARAERIDGLSKRLAALKGK